MGHEKDGAKKDGGEKKSGGNDAAAAAAAADLVVLKVEINCDGCARKVKKLVTGFSGVDDFKIDAAGNKLTVTGKVDPAKLRQRLEEKFHKKVEIVSPQPPKKDGAGAPAEKKPEEKKKVEDKKPVESTVVLKINIHCKGCSKKLIKAICKIKGVDLIGLDPSKDLVTVKGTMDVKELAHFLQAKLKRAVKVMPPKKDKESAAVEKKPDGGGEKTKPAVVAAGGPQKVEVIKTEHLGYYMPLWYNSNAHGGGGYGGNHGGHPSQAAFYPPVPYGYTAVGGPQAPHVFSDENPNACSVM